MFKKYFIPHEHNDHQPHFLRFKTIGSIVGTVLAIELLFLAEIFVFSSYRDFFAAILPDVLVDYTNRSRANQSYGSLKRSAVLDEAARMKAEDMAKKGYFAHTSPENITPWHWFREVGYDFSYAGENLAVNFFDSDAAFNAWMNSPSHRANILNNNFSEIGIATAEGVYKGRPSVFVVQLFGKPARNALSAAGAGGSAIPVAETAVKETHSPKKTVPQPEPKIVVESVPKSPEQELFVAVKSATADGSENVEMFGQSQNKSSPALPQSSLSEKVFSSPNKIINVLYGILLAMILLALLLKVFIKMHIRHPVLVTNGVLAFSVISGLLIFNRELIISLGSVF